MPIFLSHISALRAYRAGVVPTRLESGRPSEARPRSGSAPDTNKPFLLEKYCGHRAGDSLHILVADKASRTKHSSTISHVWNSPIPPGSFFCLAGDVFISTPPMLFLEMAQCLTRIELVALGYELCGMYHLTNTSELDANTPPDSEIPQCDSNKNNSPLIEDEILSHRQGFIQTSDSLTTVLDIQRHLNKFRNVKGLKDAKWALKYIAERSASPMETLVSMMLSLPALVGGFNLPRPLLNYEVNANGNASLSTRLSTRYCDFFWPDSNLALEYDSDSFHTGSQRIAKDAARRNELAYSGITVITLTSKQFFYFPALDAQVAIIEKHLKHRRTQRINDADRRRRALHRIITDKTFGQYDPT